MARVGYIEARKERDAALLYVMEKETKLAEIETAEFQVEELRTIHRKDAQLALENARLELEKAEKVFAAFQAVQPVKTRKANFDARFNVFVSLERELYVLMVTRQGEENISTAEIVRRGLRLYLMPNAPTTDRS